MTRAHLTLLAVGAAIAGLGAAASLGADEVRKAVDGTTVERPTVAPPASLQTDIEALHRPGRADDAMPLALVRGLALDDGTADVARARRVRAGTSGEGWLAPGRRGSVCHVQAGFAACPPTDYVERRGFAPSLSFRGGMYLLGGVAADGVGAIAVTTASGALLMVPIIDNTASVRLDAAPQSVSWEGPSGRETFDFTPMVVDWEQLRRTAPRRPR